ncbi:MAG: ATPase, T2SS/T4P/T4SS family, partial [Rhodoferax sp.]|nr:ATPase, T2SS/T4P/T4SS family [Rhodoferax sp.]
MTLADTLFPKEDAKFQPHGPHKSAAAGHDKTSAFSWPPPPFATYQSPEPWREPKECDIEGLNGAVRRCLLITLDPAKKVAVIQIEQNKTPVALPFAQFLRITLKKLLHPQEISTSEQFADILGHRATVDYHLVLKNGAPLSGLTIGCVETDYGLFLFPPIGDEGSIERVFMPHEVFARFTLGSHIGKVLVDHEVVTAQQVEQAAEEQTYLRNRKLGDYLLDTAVLFPEQLMQALAQQSKMPMIRVGEALTLLGYISEEQLKLALEQQKTERSVPLGELLVKMGFLTRHDLMTALARKMGYPVVDVKLFPVEDAALKKIPMTTALRLNVMPLMLRDNMTVVATVDPTQRKMLEELEFLVQGRVIATLGDELQIKQKIRESYQKFGLHHPVVDEDTDLLEDLSSGQTSSSELLESMEHSSGDDAPEDDEKAIEQSDNTLVRLINTMIIEAHGRGVSDIHVESQPRRAKVRIRFRKDGMLSPYLELPHTYRAALVARLKIMADLDISERRKPQDGKINFSKFSKKHRLELRIATIPTANGLEDVVMRLLASSKPIAMNKLGLTEINYTQLHDAISRPYGMVLCVGPTGSGKTTTLHSVLGFLNTPDRKIWTAEDPIEITQPDLRQVQ